MGVTVLTLATAEVIYTKFGMEVSHTPGKVLGYVAVVGVVGGRGNINPATTEGI